MHDTADYAARIRDGDHDAFTELVKRHYEQILRVARSVVRSGEDAQDIAQELFIRLWERREHLTAEQLTTPYLLAAVYNRGLDALKVRRVRSAHREVVQAEAAADPGRLTTRSPEEGVLSRADFEAAMRRLPARWQLVIKLRFQEQLAADDVAVVLHMTPNAVHQLTHRAVRQLRRLLQDPPLAQR